MIDPPSTAHLVDIIKSISSQCRRDFPHAFQQKKEKDSYIEKRNKVCLSKVLKLPLYVIPGHLIGNASQTRAFIFRLMLSLWLNLFCLNEQMRGFFTTRTSELGNESGVVSRNIPAAPRFSLTAGSQVSLKSLKRHSKMANLITAELWEPPFVNCGVFHYHWTLVCCWHHSYAWDQNLPANTNERNVDDVPRAGAGKSFIGTSTVFCRRLKGMTSGEFYCIWHFCPRILT